MPGSPEREIHHREADFRAVSFSSPQGFQIHDGGHDARHIDETGSPLPEAARERWAGSLRELGSMVWAVGSAREIRGIPVTCLLWSCGPQPIFGDFAVPGF